MNYKFLIVSISIFSEFSLHADDSLEIPVYIDSSAVIRHTGYTLEYSEPYEQARWVAYELTKTEVEGNVPRSENFRPDPFVITGSAALADYKYSGWDRGHLYPAGDAAWDSISMSECFYLSNMSPQDHLFNAGIWADLEQLVRDWAFEYDTIYVVTAGVLKDGLPTIGANEVAIHETFYKVILCMKGATPRGIGFLLANQDSQKSISNFAVTIDSVEQVTGIDFFPSLPDSIEANVEGHFDLSQWFLSVVDDHVPATINKSTPILSRSELMYDLRGRMIGRIHSSSYAIGAVTIQRSNMTNARKKINFFR